MPMRHRRGNSKDARVRAKSRRVGLWTPLWIVGLVLVLGWFGTPEERRPSLQEFWPSDWNSVLQALRSGTQEQANAEPQGQKLASVTELWIDPAALEWRLESSCDPRWSEELSFRVGKLDPFPLHDKLAFLDLIAMLKSISFVAHVEYGLPNAEFGCELDLVLREPVACVPSAGGFFAVDAEGVLLSGSWESPMFCDGLPLPVLGPMSDGLGLFSLARPGDWLIETEHLDALEVALSMETHLSRSAREELGRLVIDASEGRNASVQNPGVQLLLGGRRLILFGRPANSQEPGELPVDRKWASLETCLLGDGARAGELQGWNLLDLRWDHPEVDLKPVLVAQVDPAPSSPPSQPPSYSAPRNLPRAESTGRRSQVR